MAGRLAGLHQVSVVAPLSEQSAVSRGITFRHPLRVERFESEGITFVGASGTPTDCVLMALHHLLDELPDLVISGINRGPNLGDDVLYSGTVAGAMEAAIHGYPALALSLDERTNPDYAPAADWVAEWLERVQLTRIPRKAILNINFPSRPPYAGEQICRQGHSHYAQSIDRRVDPRGKEYFWVSGAIPRGEALEGTDFGAVAQGYVSITPLRMDLTAEEALEDLRDWQT